MIDGLRKNGLVYRYDSKNDKLVLCSLRKQRNGYLLFHSKGKGKKSYLVHRAVYEAFCGDIPQGYQIDHINCIRTDNRIDNLRAVTVKENLNNHLTKKHMSIAQKEAPHNPTTEFGKKFFEHFRNQVY